MKTLDVAALHAGIDDILRTIQEHQTGMKQIEMAVQGIVSLEDALQGQGGEAIRSFYRDCHLPFIKCLLRLLDEYEDVMRQIKRALGNFEPDPNGYISERFIEEEVIKSLDDFARNTGDLTNEANSILDRVSDIISLPRIDDTPVQHSIQRGKEMASGTVDVLHAFDREFTQKLQPLHDSLNIMNTYVERIGTLFQSGDLSIQNYRPQQLKSVDAYKELTHQTDVIIANLPLFDTVGDLLEYIQTYDEHANIENQMKLIEEFLAQGDFGLSTDVTGGNESAINPDLVTFLEDRSLEKVEQFKYDLHNVLYIQELIELQKFAIEKGYHPETFEPINKVDKKRILQAYEANIHGSLQWYYEESIEQYVNPPAWKRLLHFAGELTYFDYYRVSTGIDPVTKEELSKSERNIAGAWVAAGFIPISRIGKVGKIGKGTKVSKEVKGNPNQRLPNRLGNGGSGKPFVNNPYNSNGTLKPNVRYRTGEFNYIYETDNLGRISKFETDSLQLTNRKERLRHNPKTPGKQPGDHAGHVAADRFGGSPDLDNLVSQSASINRSEYRKLENTWAKAIKEGKQVQVNIDIQYSGSSSRPSSFKVLYEIDGKRFTRNLLN